MKKIKHSRSLYEYLHLLSLNFTHGACQLYYVYFVDNVLGKLGHVMVNQPPQITSACSTHE